MKVVRYVFKMYFPLMFGILGLFVAGFEILDLFLNIWQYIFNSVPVKTVLYILFLYLPKAVTYSLPLSMLFATCYMISQFSYQNELVAFFASGVSYFRLMFPLIIFAAVMTGTFIVFENKVVVPCYKTYNELKNESIHVKQDANNNNIVIRSENGKIIYKADLYEDLEKKLHGVLIIVRNDDGEVNSIVKANNAVWKEEENKWILSSAVNYDIDENGEMKKTLLKSEIEEMLTESPDSFKNNKVDVETITIKEAKQYLKYLKRTGLPSGEARSVYYKKYSFSFVLLIVTLLAIGLTGRSRRNVIIISLVLSGTASVCFYVLQMVTMNLAKFGIVTPMAGAWFPVVVFLILSVILLRNSKT
ncbi:MAG: LptF/LptG family permease [Treponema sp.]|nr:LptF/LptG family permease [Candidatus Treponema scatequi]